MKTFPKKKIELIIEAPALKNVIRAFEKRKILGYTVFPVLAGSGHEGQWDSSGAVGDSGRMNCVVCILDPAELDALMIDVEKIIRTQIGIAVISDVQVIRRDHF
jgi:PII-like signaling protein